MLTRHWMKISGALVMCAVAAVAVSKSTLLHPWQLLVPFGFVVILVMLALRYGIAVAVVGSPLAALIFAYYLYPPLHSFHVEDDAARVNLGWMVLAGIVISYLLVPRDPSARKK